MSTAAIKTVYTPDDLLTMPDGDWYELVDGQLVERKMSVLSSFVAGLIFQLLSGHCRAKRLGWVLPEGTSFQCFPQAPRRVRRADTAFIAGDRLTPAEVAQQGHCTVAPDLAVEVVSPKDLAYEVDQKVAEWLEAGVRLVWVVNPRTQFVRVCRADGTDVRLGVGDELTGGDVLPDFRCRVAELFDLSGGTEAPAGASSP